MLPENAGKSLPPIAPLIPATANILLLSASEHWGGRGEYTAPRYSKSMAILFQSPACPAHIPSRFLRNLHA
jgi:hypothetical protein